ncbi:MAG: CRISPR-associated protein Cas4 [Candidatus Omnitrophica bacterium]|nr:CRISPR-associated protein Cas4 [Candidatus Omnitrophota bacterium]
MQNSLEEINSANIRITGIKINYLYICERKLWFFDRGIQMEKTSDKVLLGKLTEEYSYPQQEHKEVLIDNLINIDIVEEDKIREIKYSNKMKEADRIQLLYYLYYLKKKLNIERKGIINYPKMRRKEEVILTEEAEKEVESAIFKVAEVIKMNKPPCFIKKPFCTKCAYYELCLG